MHDSGEILNFSGNLATQSLQRLYERTHWNQEDNRRILVLSLISCFIVQIWQCVQHVTKKNKKRSEAH